MLFNNNNNIVVAFTTLASLAAAQSTNLAFTATPQNVVAGTPVFLNYTGVSGPPISISLLHGTANSLSLIKTFTTAAQVPAFLWTPNPALPSANNYALELQQGNQSSFLEFFAITAINATTPATSPTAAPSVVSGSGSGSSSSGGNSTIGTGAKPSGSSTAVSSTSGALPQTAVSSAALLVAIVAAAFVL